MVARIDLVEPADVAETFAREPEAVALAPEVVALAPEVVAPEPDAIPSRAPTPALLDRKKAQQVPAVPAPDQAEPEIAARSATNQLRLTVDTLRVELRTTKARVDQLESEHAALLNERNTLTRLHAEQQRELTRAQDELARLRTRLRRASKAPHSTTRVLPRFADRERAFRYAVETAWAERTPVGEQLESPLPELQDRPRLPGLGRGAQRRHDRQDRRRRVRGGHRSRRPEPGPDAPYVHRSSDGATCWRAALQRGTPQARRLHFWRLANREIELSRVVKHDDMRP